MIDEEVVTSKAPIQIIKKIKKEKLDIKDIEE